MALMMVLMMAFCTKPSVQTTNQVREASQPLKPARIGTFASLAMIKQRLRVSFQHQPWALLVATSCILGVTIPGARAQNMEDDLINHYCTQAMNADFAKAGQTPPTGMVAYTCNCVIQQVNARATIAQAKSICQQQATAKFPTP
jgi:hypothetical protein